MKTADPATVDRLEDLPNIGKAMAADLRLLGISHPKDLCGKNPLELYTELNRLTGYRHDLCVLDVFMAVVDFMAGGGVKPWWAFTGRRRQLLDIAAQSNRS